MALAALFHLGLAAVPRRIGRYLPKIKTPWTLTFAEAFCSLYSDLDVW